MTQQDLNVDSGAPDRERLAEHEADFTPEPVVRQMMLQVRDTIGVYPRVMLDPCAGAGVFAKVANEVWEDDIAVESVEPREEEREHLERHSSDTWSMTAQEYAAKFFTRKNYSWDLIATNPPFSLWPELVELCFPVLRDRSSAIVLLGRTEWGQSAAGDGVFRRRPPLLQMRIPGRINFRGPGINPNTGKPWQYDSWSYSWWVWTLDPRPPIGAWGCYNLPLLPPEDRRWTVRPGTEP